MRRKLVVTVALVVAVGTGLIIGGALPASSQGGRTRFTVCEKDSKGFSRDIDADGNGEFSPGDYQMFTDPWFDPATGRRHGRDAGVFTFIRPSGDRNGWFQVVATAFFAEGRITVTATGKFSWSATKDGTNFPITGGTGHYRNASGTVTIKDAHCDGKKGSRLTFDVDLR